MTLERSALPSNRAIRALPSGRWTYAPRALSAESDWKSVSVLTPSLLVLRACLPVSTLPPEGPARPAFFLAALILALASSRDDNLRRLVASPSVSALYSPPYRSTSLCFHYQCTHSSKSTQTKGPAQNGQALDLGNTQGKLRLGFLVGVFFL